MAVHCRFPSMVRSTSYSSFLSALDALRVTPRSLLLLIYDGVPRVVAPRFDRSDCNSFPSCLVRRLCGDMEAEVAATAALEGAAALVCVGDGARQVFQPVQPARILF